MCGGGFAGGIRGTGDVEEVVSAEDTVALARLVHLARARHISSCTDDTPITS